MGNVFLQQQCTPKAIKWAERIKANKPNDNMYSNAGATFQEYCLAHLDCKGSEAHSAIGRLVTAINNGFMPVDIAIATFNGLLSK